MQSGHADQSPAKGARWSLALFVHFDAFWAEPRAYIVAMWWRLRRKRVRAWGRLGPLLSISPRAYEWWLLGEDRTPAEEQGSPSLPILALVDVGVGQKDLEETLSSLSDEGVPALLIGAEELQTLAEASARIDWSSNPWLMPIAAGDRLAPGAALAYRTAVAEAEAWIAYADDDLLDKAGRRSKPHFKPDWNSELFRHFDYLTGACIVRASREEFEEAAAAEHGTGQLIAEATEKGTPLHVRRVLHHRRGMRPCPKVPATAYRSSCELPAVTVIVPTRNRVDLLQKCLNGVAATDYPDVEVIVVDNDSDDPHTLAFLAGLDPVRYRVLRHAGAFNYSAINNRAAAQASGALLCLLNNDIEVIEPNWLAIMAAQALRDDVGAVGARLLYPDGRIQHAGVVLGVGNAAGHAHRFLDPDEEGYFSRHALPQFTTAVTAACLVVAHDRFRSVNGFDERNFAVAFNDVDLCMRLNQRGWQSLYEPRATLIHHESVSRGLDCDPVGAARFAGELAALKQLWGTDEAVDPFHHPELSRASERFVAKLWGS